MHPIETITHIGSLLGKVIDGLASLREPIRDASILSIPQEYHTAELDKLQKQAHERLQKTLRNATDQCALIYNNLLTAASQASGPDWA